MKSSLAVLLCTSLVAAQGVVSPIHFDMAEGPNGATAPFGLTNTDDRHLQVHNDINTARTINRLMFRLDGSEALSGAMAFTATVRLSRAAAGVNAGNLQPVFANNHGTGLTTFANLNINFPATASTINPGRPFDRIITLPTPYAFAGGGPLCWEVEISGRTTTQGAAFDSITSPNGQTAPPLAVVQPIGQGCKVNQGAAGPLRLDITTTTDWNAGGAVRFVFTTTNALSTGTADNRVFVFYGFNRNSFMGLNLPWALPGTGAPLGVCTLYTSVANFLLSGPINRITTQSGLVYEIGLYPQLNGCEIFFQSMGLTADAVYGVALSNMVACQVIAPFGQAPLGSVSGRGAGSAVAGTTAPFSGLITRFE